MWTHMWSRCGKSLAETKSAIAERMKRAFVRVTESSSDWIPDLSYPTVADKFRDNGQVPSTFSIIAIAYGVSLNSRESLKTARS